MHQNGLGSNIRLHGEGDTHLVSSGTRPRQAIHIITPPISVRPPATQPTNRAEPKVYLSGEMMALNVDDSTLKAPPTATSHARPLVSPFEFYPIPAHAPQTHIPLGHSQLNQVPWRIALGLLLVIKQQDFLRPSESGGDCDWQIGESEP